MLKKILLSFFILGSSGGFSVAPDYLTPLHSKAKLYGPAAIKFLEQPQHRTHEDFKELTVLSVQMQQLWRDYVDSFGHLKDTSFKDKTQKQQNEENIISQELEKLCAIDTSSHSLIALCLLEDCIPNLEDNLYIADPEKRLEDPMRLNEYKNLMHDYKKNDFQYKGWIVKKLSDPLNYTIPIGIYPTAEHPTALLIAKNSFTNENQREFIANKTSEAIERFEDILMPVAQSLWNISADEYWDKKFLDLEQKTKSEINNKAEKRGLSHVPGEQDYIVEASIENILSFKNSQHEFARQAVKTYEENLLKIKTKKTHRLVNEQIQSIFSPCIEDISFVPEETKHNKNGKINPLQFSYKNEDEEKETFKVDFETFAQWSKMNRFFQMSLKSLVIPKILKILSWLEDPNFFYFSWANWNSIVRMKQAEPYVLIPLDQKENYILDRLVPDYQKDNPTNLNRNFANYYVKVEKFGREVDNRIDEVIFQAYNPHKDHIRTGIKD